MPWSEGPPPRSSNASVWGTGGSYPAEYNPTVSDEAPASNGAVPLADLHLSLGAQLEPSPFGFDLPAHYGSVSDEYNALRRSCGIADRSWVPDLEMTGEDRVRFLNGLMTCDVREPSPGEGCYGFLTDAKGKVLADAGVLVFEDRLLLELPPGRGQAIAEHLRKYVIADRVEIREVDDVLPLAIVGPTSGRCLDRLAGESLSRDDWRHRRIALLGHEVDVCSHPRLGVAAFVMRVDRAHAEDLFGALADRKAGAEFMPVGQLAVDTVRVEGGNAIVGVDLDPATLPQETGDLEAVSYTKGCYLGQEIVARVHYRGQVNRHLRGLRFEAVEPPEAGARVTFEGQAVGVVSSPLTSPRLGQPIGLSLIHRKASDPGTRVEVDGCGEAEVAELPFVHTGIA